jgi:hypothetical protein
VISSFVMGRAFATGSAGSGEAVLIDRYGAPNEVAGAVLTLPTSSA